MSVGKVLIIEFSKFKSKLLQFCDITYNYCVYFWKMKSFLIIIFFIISQKMIAQDTLSIVKGVKANDFINIYSILNEDKTISYTKYSLFSKQVVTEKIITIPNIDFYRKKLYECHPNYKTLNDSSFIEARLLNEINVPETKETQFMVDYLMNNEIEGRVYLEFIIEKDGRINDAYVLRPSIHPYVDYIMILSAKNLMFKPAMLNGKLERVKYILPFNFSFL